MQMRVMLPGESDTPVHLNVQLGIAHISGKRQRRCDRRDEAELLLVLSGGASGVPYRGDRRLRAHQHVRAVMLYRLEGCDGPAKLLTHLGVVHSGVDAICRTTNGFRSHQCARASESRFPR